MFSGNIIEKKWEWRKTHKNFLILLIFAGEGLLWGAKYRGFLEINDNH